MVRIAGKRALALLLAVATPALLVINCGRAEPPTTSLLREADRHLGRAIEEIKGLEGFNEETRALLSGDRPPGTAEKLEQVLLEARSRARSSLDELEKASRKLGEAGSLDISSTMKEYLRLKSAAVAEQKKSLEATIEAMELRLGTIDAMLANAPLDQALLATMAEIGRLEEEARKAAESAAALHREANDYYEKKSQGR